MVYYVKNKVSGLVVPRAFFSLAIVFFTLGLSAWVYLQQISVRSVCYREPDMANDKRINLHHLDISGEKSRIEGNFDHASKRCVLSTGQAL